METGWKSKRICHLCTAEGWHDPTDQASWVHDGCGPTPFKLDQPPSPFLDIPGCNDARYMTLDFCHAFHLGSGIDLSASTIVLLSNLNYFPGRSLDSKLSQAFADYMRWCHDNGRVTSLTSFSKQEFDMASNPDLGITVFVVCISLFLNGMVTPMNQIVHNQNRF